MGDEETILSGGRRDGLEESEGRARE